MSGVARAAPSAGQRRRASPPALAARWLLCLELLAVLVPAHSQDVVPDAMEVEDVVLTPDSPYRVHVGIGEAKFMRFSCMGGPADAGISLSTFQRDADPLLFISLTDERPSFRSHDASTFAQWREDVTSGDPFVVAKGVSSRGGWLGLFNTKHFAGEALEGIIRIHCSFIVAFDTFFWDHLRSSSICPVGGIPDQGNTLVPTMAFCSGHGSCGRGGVCECDEGHAGPACSHSLTDYSVAAEGRYNFQVATDRYQYFRVRVPPSFRGGYLQVTVKSSKPLVVLLKNDGLPTKRNYQLSNFDDWMNGRTETMMKYKVDAPAGAAGSYEAPIRHRRLQGRRPASQWMKDGPVSSWGEVFRRARGVGVEAVSSNDEGSSHERTLVDAPQTCPGMPKPPLTDPACKTVEYARCESNCNKCVSCIQGDGDGGIGAGDQDEEGAANPGCESACQECSYSGCVRAFEACAGNTSCDGPEVERCEKSCGSCMTCFSGKDCGRCGCCVGCLPLAAKCSAHVQKATEDNMFAFVAVFNHRRPGQPDDRIEGFADIKLQEDPYFDAEQDLPSSWMAALYNPFHDIASLEFTQVEEYPAGNKYIYSLTLAERGELNMEVQLNRERVTLLHVNMSNSDTADMQLQFQGSLKIRHVLSTRQRAPRSFFDFDQVHTLDDQQVQITAEGMPAIWCAIFGAEDGFVEVKAQAISNGSSFTSWVAGALLCVLLCAFGALATGKTCGKSRLLGYDCALADPATCGDAVAELVLEPNPEDAFLHRGGNIGDDGI